MKGSQQDERNWRFIVKVVVIGGTGLIGSKVVAKLTEHGHEAVAASPASGVNTLTGEGLDEVLTGARVVVDDHTLVPAAAATVFPTRFTDWLVDNAPAPVR
jgi:nucleoside-diphosphate-sugar epimerase